MQCGHFTSKPLQHELNWIYWAHLQPWGAELLNKLYNNTTICHPRENKNFKNTTEIVPWSGSTCCAPVQCPPLVRILEAASDVCCIAHSEQTLGAYLKTHRHTVSARNVQDTIFWKPSRTRFTITNLHVTVCYSNKWKWTIYDGPPMPESYYPLICILWILQVITSQMRFLFDHLYILRLYDSSMHIVDLKRGFKV